MSGSPCFLTRRLCYQVCGIWKAVAFGIQQLELAVSAEATPALRFYERHGFEAAGRIANALRDEGEIIDELIMIRRLNE